MSIAPNTNQSFTLDTVCDNESSCVEKDTISTAKTEDKNLGLSDQTLDRVNISNKSAPCFESFQQTTESHHETFKQTIKNEITDAKCDIKTSSCSYIVTKELSKFDEKILTQEISSFYDISNSSTV